MSNTCITYNHFIIYLAFLPLTVEVGLFRLWLFNTILKLWKFMLFQVELELSLGVQIKATLYFSQVPVPDILTCQNLRPKP